MLVYEWAEGAWTQRGQDTDMRGDDADDGLGWAVALSANGEILAVGVPQTEHPASNDWNRGEVHVYAYNSGTGRWGRRGSAHLGGDANEDFLGYSVAISADGNVVAAGAYQGQFRTGYARVYAWNEGSADYVQRGTTDMHGPILDRGDSYFGWSVALSSDGGVVAVGGKSNWQNPGFVGVYAWNGVDAHAPVGSTVRRGPDNDDGEYGWAVASRRRHRARGAPRSMLTTLAKGSAYAYALQFSERSWATRTLRARRPSRPVDPHRKRTAPT